MSGLNPSDSNISMAQRWVMAVPWHAVLRWEVPWERFGLVPCPARSALAVIALERQFGIVTTADVERALVTFDASSHMRDAAWHLSNAVLVAELAYAAYLLDEARAWQAAVDAARALQRHHRGWFAMAEGYLRGLAVQRPESADDGARELLTQLFATPDSPWNTIPWATQLPALLPPPRRSEAERERVIHVDRPELLTDTLAAAPEACRIQLGPGVYHGGFDLGARVLERADHAPAGSVIIAARPGEPAIDIAAGGGARVCGLTFRASASAPAVRVRAGFLRLEDCRFEGGHSGVEAGPETSAAATARILQLEGVVFDGQADSAIVLTLSTCRAHDVVVHGVGGSGVTAEASRLHLDDALIEAPDRAGVFATGGALVLRKVRIHDAQRWGVALSGAAKAELIDVEVMRGLVGLRAAEGAVVSAERCRLADATTANVELLDIASARFHDCHITGGQWSGVWLHPGGETTFKGGQIGGSRLACVVVEGGRNVTLHGVGIGPSREGGGIFATSKAELHAEGVFVSGAALAGVELRDATLFARDLRVRGSVEGVLVRDGARLEGRRVDLAEVAGTGLWLAGGTAAVDGLGLRKVAFGLVVGAAASGLVHNLVAAHTPVVVQVEGGRLALAGQLSFGGGLVRVKSGLLAARGLEDTTVAARDASLYFQGGRLGALDLEGRTRLVLVSVAGDDRARPGPELEIVRDPVAPPFTATSPLLLAGPPESFEPWGMGADPFLLVRVATALIRRLGLSDKLAVREAGQGARVDGGLPAIARFAPAFELLFVEPGALGLILAELLDAPRADPQDPGGPTGLE